MSDLNSNLENLEGMNDILNDPSKQNVIRSTLIMQSKQNLLDLCFQKQI